MKSVVINKPNELVIEQREIPLPKKGEVRVKVSLAGICGSDGHIYRGHNPFAKYPRVIGHEFFGVIDRVGDAVDNSIVGTRVSIDPVISCGHCYPCSIGKPNVCKTLAVMGVHVDGGFSQYVCVPAQNAYTIIDDISDEFAATVEPFSIAANVTGHLKPTEDDVALIYGAGTMGLTCVQVLKGVYKVKEVIVVDRVGERLVKAQACGADKVINNTSSQLQEQLEELNIQPTLIIDAACHPSILAEAISIASPAARISIMGFSKEPCQIIQQGITSKELAIFSSRLNAKKFPQVIEWMAQKLINPALLITHRFNLEDVVTALDVFEHDQQHCCKILLTFS